MIPGKQPSHPTFKRSFLFAIQGFITAVGTERNIKVMLGGAAFAIVVGIIVELDVLSWCIVLVCCGCVLAAELTNSAIETIVDLVSPEFHPLAGRAKDVAAAASWVISLTSALVGAIVYLRALLILLGVI